MRKTWLAFFTAFCWLLPTVAYAQNLNLSLDGEVTHNPMDLDARVHFSKMDQNDNLCALIKVSVTNELKYPLVLSIGANLAIIDRQEQEDGEIWYWVPYQTKNLSFSCKGYTDVPPIPVRLEEGKVYRLTLRSDAVVQTVTNVTATTNFLKMNIQPADVTVSIGKTPDCEMHTEYIADGFFQRQINHGEYYYRIENPLYETKTGKITVSSENKTHNLSLDPAYSYLDFRSEPSGAMVIVNGKVLGETPLRSDEKFQRGALQVRLQKDEYSPLIETIQVKGDGQTQLVNFQLDAQFATVTCTSQDPKAEIWVDNTYRGIGSWTGHLSSTMNHVLEARRTSHQSQGISFTVQAGQTVTKTVGAPVPLYGILSIQTTPSNCVVTIDGESVGNSPLIQNILIGKHQIVIRKEGYLSEQFEVDVRHQQTLNVEKTLEKGRLIADVTVKTKSGADVYAGNTYLGKSENGQWKGQLQEGKYEIRSVLKDHNDGRTTYEIVGKGPFTIVVPDPVHKKGGVKISTRSGASIQLREGNDDFRKVGTGSYSNFSLNTGEYAVYATKNGYHNSPTKYFNIKEGQTTNISLDLKKRRWITETTLFDTRYFAEINYGFGIELGDGIIPRYSANYWGATLGLVPDRWGGYFSGMFGTDFGEFAATAGPILRLNDYDTDWQFYLGAGLITGDHFNWLGEAGLRLGLDALDTEFELLSLTLGAKFNDELVLPQIGVGLAPLALLTTDNSDFSMFCLDYLTGYNTDYGSWMFGFSFSHCLTNLGIYTSMMWGDGTSSYVLGPVIRLTTDYNDVDWQLYGGPGYIDDELGFDVGMRFDFPIDSAVGMLDFSLGCQFYPDGGCIPYLGMSWVFALCGGWLTCLAGMDLDTY